MKTSSTHAVSLSAKLIESAAFRTETLTMPATDQTTTADRLLFLKDCLDKHLIDEAVFRALRDELTYGLDLA